MVNHMRHTKGHRDQRRANQKLTPESLSICSHCKEKKLSHKVCAACGYYNGKQVIDVLKKLDKKERKKKEMEMAEKEEAKT